MAEPTGLMALRDRVAYLAPWRRMYGKPDGVFPRLRCLRLGHKWWPCDEGCCNRWWCERCLVSGPTLDKDPRLDAYRRRPRLEERV